MPETRDVSSGSSWPFAPGMAGMPRSARSTTVPDKPSILACWTSTSNSSGVRVGSFLSALAVAATQAGARHDEHEGQRRHQAQRWFGIEDPHVPIVASLTVRTLCLTLRSLRSVSRMAR